MAKITDISTQKKRDTRVSIFLDGRFYCGLEKITVLNEGLSIGDEFSDGELEAIQLKSDSATAFDRAIKYISVRQRTEKELHRYLKDKGYLPAVITNVLDKMKEYRYINDDQFAASYIATYRHKMGEKMLVMKLKSLGVSQFAIMDAMENLGDQSEEAVAIAEKYLRSHNADRNKLYAFLYNKGFDYATIKEAMAAVEESLNNNNSEEDE